MTTQFVKNTKYDIKTPYGWEDFQGIVRTDQNKDMCTIVTNTNSISCTKEHKFPMGTLDNIVTAGELNIGDIIFDGNNNPIEILDIKYGANETVYDIFETETHSVITDNIHTKQCDELAFVDPKISRAFWASVFPTLSCLAPDTYILTNNGYELISEYFTGEESPGSYFTIDNRRIYGKEGIEDISHCYVSPKGKTLKITTKTGYKVEVTLDHPLYTRKSNGIMVSAKDLVISDQLRCDIGMNVFGNLSVKNAHGLGSRKEFKEELMRANRESIILYLDRLFHNEYSVSLSKNILYKIKLMLSNLGVVSSIENNTITIIDIEEFDEIITHDKITPTQFIWDSIVSIEESYQDITYDFTVPNTHTFLQNGILGSNTGGRAIITSTPSGDEDLFAQLWFDANKTIDEYGNETDKGVNGFKAFKAKWDEHPERDEEYKANQISNFGEEIFLREHELEFISMEDTLIDPIFLRDLKSIAPIAKTKDVRWFSKLRKDQLYIISYDPSLGTGRDNAAIVIFEFPSLIQVGEWIHNKSDVPTQIGVLKNILDLFKKQGFDEDNIFWSLENNSIGEAALVMIKEIGEDEFFGSFMREKKRRGTGRIRGGFYTDLAEKMKACNRFKTWLEQGKLIVNSKTLVSELKGFVSKGRSYAARSGIKDDIVMATLLMVRMAEIIMKEEEDYLEELGITATNINSDDDEEEDDWGSPMPILV